MANKDDNAALAEYQHALAINPRISDAMLYSAGTTLRQGNPAKAIELLQAAGYQGELKNLRGGITAWSNEVDPKVPKY